MPRGRSAGRRRPAVRTAPPARGPATARPRTVGGRAPSPPSVDVSRRAVAVRRGTALRRADLRWTRGIKESDHLVQIERDAELADLMVRFFTGQPCETLPCLNPVESFDSPARRSAAG
ncbi:hypothetical protein ACWDX6_27050 [Streptomyces sp. NPDC003027]